MALPELCLTVRACVRKDTSGLWLPATPAKTNQAGIAANYARGRARLDG